MPRMPARYKDEFVRLAGFVRETMPQVGQDGPIVESFCRHSGCDRAVIVAALQWDALPWLDVKDLNQAGHGAFGADSLFDPRFPDRIGIARDIALRFEQDHALPQAQRLVKVAVLRELLHWADFRDGAMRGLGQDDPALAFEQEAFDGESARRWWPGPTPVASENRLCIPMTGRIGGGTSYWGRNIRDNGTRSHFGWDIFAPLGTSVHAVADGTVLTGNRYRRGGDRLAETGNYGQMIDIDHGNGLVSRYAHLQTVDVEAGATLPQGDRIGTMGATGTLWGKWLHDGKPQPGAPAGATEPHLHFELRKADGAPFGQFDATYDPALFFDFVGRGPLARNTALQALMPGTPLQDIMLDAGPDEAGALKAGALDDMVLFDYEPLGASAQTAAQDDLAITGPQASIELARHDKDRVAQLRPVFEDVGRDLGVPPALLAGIASRESRCGAVLGDDGFDGGHHAFGIMQVDRRSHGLRGTSSPGSAEHIRQAAGILADYYEKMRRKFEGEAVERCLQAAVAAYNAGPAKVDSVDGADRLTTGHDYSNDVWARARFFAGAWSRPD